MALTELNAGSISTVYEDPFMLESDITTSLPNQACSEEVLGTFPYYLCAYKSKFPSFYIDGNDAVFVRSRGLERPEARMFLVYMCPIWLLIGIAANILSMVIMRTKDMR